MFTTVTPTDAERAAGEFDEERARAAAEALWRDGAVVLAGVIDLGHVEALRNAMEAEIPELVSRGKTNGPPGHYGQRPPIAAPYVFPDVVANRFAAQVAALAVGSPVQLTLFNGNTILPNTEPQGLHRDHGNLWKDADQSHRPAFVSVHVPLTGMDERNGSTEIWPGTHRLAHEGQVPSEDAELAARAALSPPVQVSCPAGGIVLRDGRAWHRGMPNLSERPRIMISMIYAAYWSRQGITPFHRSAEGALRDAPLELNPTWVGDEYDHLTDVRDAARAGAPGSR
jgi:ectoine hydroxylase-related dioxygenase (phytanoyl-CoA dioxygenase family)